ncbi:cation transport protein ChaC [Rhizobiales bacterium GAS188]|nr:cation transport protein ChaC [Rhizobiales bacterium GAS188]
MSVKDDDGDFWVFGYGSLMWRPGFPHVERHAARLNGYHRSLCLYSHGYRGTPERPGLVLGLDHGGSCVGVGFRVDAADREATRAYLTWREGTEVYRALSVNLWLVDGRRVSALAYVVKRSHPHYAGRLSQPQLLDHVRLAHGDKGSCRDYVVSTHAHLVSLGVHDAHLAWLAEQLGMPHDQAAAHGHVAMAREVETHIH